MASADRGQFFRAAAEAMRRVHVDHARRKRAAKRCGRRRRFDLCEGDRVAVPDRDALLAVDVALKALKVDDPESADVARLRLFPGPSVDEAAAALGVSGATTFRDWAYARAYLTSALAAE